MLLSNVGTDSTRESYVLRSAELVTNWVWIVTAVLTSREVLKEGVAETSVVQSQHSTGKMAVEASEQRESCR